MKKAEISTRLDEALTHLKKAAATSRPKKTLREEWEVFVSETRAAQAEAAAGRNNGEQNYRLARIENPKTGQPVWVQPRTDGGLIPGDAKRLGVETVPEWIQVRAESRAEATAKAETGEGQVFKRSKAGNVREVTAKESS